MHGLIVADAGQARLYTADAALEGVREVVALVHPEARLKGSDIYTDGHGRRSGVMLDPRTGRREHEQETFARFVAAEAASHLATAERWVVVAAPSFLGQLRRFLDDKRIVAEIAKDLTSLTVHEIGPAVRKQLPPTAGMP